jgi:Protein of unknown function (DUF541)
MIAQRTAVVLGGCALALGAPAAAQAASDQTITALGSAQVKVKPSNRHSNAAIKRAVDVAYKRSVPKAIADAREDAARIAKSSGLTLGAIQSVDENVNTGFAYYGPQFGLAPFGPDQYCARISRRFHTRDAQGRLHTRTRRQKVCRVPEFAFSTLAVTFAATPAS